MGHARRVAAIGAAALLAVALAACGATTAPSPPGPSASSVPTAAAPTSAATPTPAPGGVTTDSDVFGSACSQLPQGTAPGSLTAMGKQPVAAAAASTPLLTTLAAAIGKVPGLADALNLQQGGTVFAPDNAAFTALQKAMGDGAYTALMADPTRLDALLSYHVSSTRIDAAGLVKAGKLTELSGGDLVVGGTAAEPTVTSSGGAVAKILCGNIPTANATVFVIDKVLTAKS